MNIGTKPSKIYEELMDACLSNRSKDNMTVIIVHLLHGQRYVYLQLTQYWLKNYM